MYTPPQFREERREILLKAMRDIQFAALVTAAEEGLQASHLPMVVKEERDALFLEGHVARPNTHWSLLGRPWASLAIFQGPQAYVSPSWYETKRQHGKVVPTWNYIAVHAHGRLEAIEDPDWLLTHLADLTDANERHREEPWALTDAPAGFVDKLARGIVGVRLAVERLEGSWKLIQHRAEGDRRGAIAGLRASREPGDEAVAAAMAAREEAAPRE